MNKAKKLLTVLVITVLIAGDFANIVASAIPIAEGIKVIQPAMQSIDPPLP